MRRLSRKKKRQQKNGNKDKILKEIIFVTAILKFIKSIKDLID